MCDTNFDCHKNTDDQIRGILIITHIPQTFKLKEITSELNFGP